MALPHLHRRMVKKVLLILYVSWTMVFIIYLSAKRKELDVRLEALTANRKGLAGPSDFSDKEERHGKMGSGVKLTNLNEEEKHLVKQGWHRHAFNEYVSNMISLHRSLPDVRHPGCRNEKYREELPQTSVIICFHNEAWSTLLRTVHSILDRSPPKYIKEIILVDDYSDMSHLQKKLEDYVEALKIVRIIRAHKREGLIRCRMLGAVAAKAPVLTFLDSHCECTEGWVEPLLGRIAEDSTNVVAPTIDIISDETFEYVMHEDDFEPSIGGFDWSLEFNWFKLPDRERQRRKKDWEAIRTPTIAGGLFSIDKKFFEKLGMYDDGFDIWGGENLEISFKTWMCGGTLEILPCSRVGHIFRKRSPYSWKLGTDVFKKNSVRLAEVWMDEYKKHFYERINYELGNYGDVESRKMLRSRLKCKSFDWYVKNIYPELFIPTDAAARGQIRNIALGNDTCLDSEAHAEMVKPVKLWPCHGEGGNQYWFMSHLGELRREESCLDYDGEGEVMMYPCHGGQGNQHWRYEPSVQLLRHVVASKCLEMMPDKKTLDIKPCQLIEQQMWIIENYNASRLQDYSTTITTKPQDLTQSTIDRRRMTYTIKKNFLPLPFLKKNARQ